MRFFFPQAREARDARDYTVLALVEACVDDAHAWAPDVASALKIITSQATPQVKAHLLAPIVFLSVCLCGCVCLWIARVWKRRRGRRRVLSVAGRVS